MLVRLRVNKVLNRCLNAAIRLALESTQTDTHLSKSGTNLMASINALTAQFNPMNTNKTQKSVSHSGTPQSENHPQTATPRLHTLSARVEGALCGHIWMPAVKATLAFSEDLHARFNRFSDKSGATFRDALLSALSERGGDFQNPSFTADTILIIKRIRNVRPGKSEIRIREIEISNLPDCADLVDADTYSYDFTEED